MTRLGSRLLAVLLAQPRVARYRDGDRVADGWSFRSAEFRSQAGRMLRPLRAIGCPGRPGHEHRFRRLEPVPFGIDLYLVGLLTPVRPGFDPPGQPGRALADAEGGAVVLESRRAYLDALHRLLLRQSVRRIEIGDEYVDPAAA